MQRALYEPGEGYYCRQTPAIGASGDYYTSPHAHPGFAALLALQAEQAWRLVGAPATFTVVEIGGGKGMLAADFVSYAQHLSPEFFHALDYVLIEQSPTNGELPPKVRRVIGTALDDLPISGVTGCFISNEFFDALPVHRVVQTGGHLQELYVTIGADGRLVEEAGDPSTPELEAYFRWVGASLPEGCQAEVNLEAPRWMANVARALDQGYIITIDYGDTAPELFSTRRPRGTLMCYYRHTATEDPYQHLGEQDITASVDFTALTKAGEAAGASLLGLLPQGAFLWNLGLPVFIEALSRLQLSQNEYYTNLIALRDLARPEGLGSFRVLVQGKGVPETGLDGLADPQGPHPNWDRGAGLPVPRLDQRHIPLLKARYPHLAVNLEEAFG